MSDPKGWHRPTGVEVDGQSVRWVDVAKAIAYLGATALLIGGIVVWRQFNKVGR